MSESVAIHVHNRRCLICKKGFTRDLKLNQHIPDNKACHTCQFWVDQGMAGDSIIVNRNHYRSGNDGGMTTPVTITFEDGRVEHVTHLWHQGTIPKEFDIWLPDNATMELTV